jgi:hypothetical protein
MTVGRMSKNDQNLICQLHRPGQRTRSMRKQLDPRIPILIDNNVQKNHRSFIVLIGDKGRDQVRSLEEIQLRDWMLTMVQIVNLHYLLSQTRVSARPSVLWCYKKDLGFTSHRKKREAKIKRDVKRGIREPNEQNPFEIFVTVTDIRYTCVCWFSVSDVVMLTCPRLLDITRNHIKSSVTHMGCVYYKTSRLLRRTCSQGPSRR